MEIAKKNEFVEIKYTGTANGEIFDSNIEADLKKINSNAKPAQTIVSIGHEMILKGLDDALDGKEIGKDYEIKLTPKEAFGERDKNLMRTIPLKIFLEKKINPYPGMILSLDEAIVKIVAVSGARVIADFNNPLAGKNILYKFSIIRKVDDDKEKCSAVFQTLLRFIPEYQINDKEVVIKVPKQIEPFIKTLKTKFDEITGKNLKFELVDEKKTDNKDSNNISQIVENQKN